jgi:antitoxin HigA-1
MSERRIPPVHPGQVLREDFLKPMGISQYRLAKSLGVPCNGFTIWRTGAAP